MQLRACIQTKELYRPHLVSDLYSKEIHLLGGTAILHIYVCVEFAIHVPNHLIDQLTHMVDS